MNDDHTQAFVSECRESITALNNALLTLEDDPDDAEAIESVFRTAHTLKGNFGAMGFRTPANSPTCSRTSSTRSAPERST